MVNHPSGTRDGGATTRPLIAALGVVVSAAVATLVILTLPPLRRHEQAELFGVDAFNPGDSSSYGPVDFHMDAGMKSVLKEYANHGGTFKSGNSWGPSNGGASLESRRLLGPEAADMLRSASTAAALKAYRSAPQDAPTQQLSEESAPSVVGAKHAAAPSYEWSNSWHPGRLQDARGSGMSLLNSRGTQEALRQLEAHEQLQTNQEGSSMASRSMPPSLTASQQPLAMHLSLKQQEQSDSALLATKLTDHAGFTKVQNRGQALEAIKDLLEERLGNVGQQEEGHTMSLSTAQGLKVQRARLEGLLQSIKHTEQDMLAAKGKEQSMSKGRGRQGHAKAKYQSKEDKLRALQRAVISKESAVHAEERQARREGRTARNKESEALAVERKEMAAFGRADMARRSALKFAQKLLQEKAHAKLLQSKIDHGLKRAADYEKEGHDLRQLSDKEKANFEHMAGPVHKAQEEVKLANQAYNAAELKLARAETTAEQLSGHPKLRDAAVEKIEHDRRLSMRMEALVRTATRRLRDLEGRNGPLTGLDSHFESPKKRAVRKLARARQIKGSMETLRQREEVLKQDVQSELPMLKKEIARAKNLHASYEAVRSEAEAAEKKAREAEAAAQKKTDEARRDDQGANMMREELRQGESGMGSALMQEEETDWKKLKNMHEELVTDKENYESARKRSCAHGGPCPPARADGLPYRG